MSGRKGEAAMPLTRVSSVPEVEAILRELGVADATPTP